MWPSRVFMYNNYGLIMNLTIKVWICDWLNS